MENEKFYRSKDPKDYFVTFDKDLDTFCKSNQINFYPWIGSNYESGLKGKRTLIMGESFYLDDWNPEGRLDWCMTKDACPLAIRKYLGEQPIDINKKGEDPILVYKPITKAFITHDKATRFLSGIFNGKVPPHIRKEIWHSVMYTVFIQNSFRKHVADGSPFPSNEIETDKRVLNTLINQYHPNLVIIYSKMVQNLLMHDPSLYYIRLDENGRELKSYIWESNGVTFWGVPHPSILRSRVSLQDLNSLYLKILNK